MSKNTSKRIFDISIFVVFIGGIALMLFILLAPKGCVVDVVGAMAPSEVERAWKDLLPLSLRREPAFLWPKEYADRPNLLILGDQASVDLTVPLRIAFEKEVDIFRIPAIPEQFPEDWERLPHWLSVQPWDALLVVLDTPTVPTPKQMDPVVSMLKELGKPVFWLVKATALETAELEDGYRYLQSEGVILIPITGSDRMEQAEAIKTLLNDAFETEQG